MSAEPIFIVGPPRSGTSLLAAIVGSHTHISCGPETHFFNKLSESDLQAAILDPKWPQVAVGKLRSLTLAEQRVTDLFHLSEEELVTYLAHRRPSIRAMLEAITDAHRVRDGKNRWAEKTPNHLLHLTRIRSVFPRSPIIRIVRDPRAAALSMRKLPWASQSVLANCYLLTEWFEASSGFFTSDTRVLTLTYESLMQDPEEQLRRICTFLDEQFEPEMLVNDQARRSVVSLNEPWKSDVVRPLDRSSVNAWQSSLPAPIKDAASLICFPVLLAHDYEVTVAPSSELPAYNLTPSAVESAERVIIEAASLGTRIIRCRHSIRAQRLLFLFDRRGSARCYLAHYGSAAWLILIRWILKRRNYFENPLPQGEHRFFTGMLWRVLTLLGQPFDAASRRR